MKRFLTIGSAESNNRLEGFIESSKKELDTFFKLKIPEPLIFLLKSRKEIDLLQNKKTEGWLVGWIRFGSIFILDPEVYTKESTHKNRDDFWKSLKHEYCHLYFQSLVGIGTPLWLNEGLASYFAKQRPICSKDDIWNIFYYFKNKDKNIYGVGYFWINLLIEKFGKNKLLALIKSLNPKISKQQFAHIFYEIYGVGFNKKSLSRIIK